jgi:hypothetical protein
MLGLHVAKKGVVLVEESAPTSDFIVSSAANRVASWWCLGKIYNNAHAGVFMSCPE